MEGSKKYLPGEGRRKKEPLGRVFAASEEVREQHAFSLYRWGRSKERNTPLTCVLAPCAAPASHPVPMLIKSDCATTCVATHCTKFLVQQILVTCQLPVELRPCL